MVSKNYVVNYKALIKKLFSFINGLLVTRIMNIGITYVSVDLILINDVVMKVILNIFALIMNYIASKLLIFK